MARKRIDINKEAREMYRALALAFKERFEGDPRFSDLFEWMPPGDPLRSISYYWLLILKKIQERINEVGEWPEIEGAYIDLLKEIESKGMPDIHSQSSELAEWIRNKRDRIHELIKKDIELIEYARPEFKEVVEAASSELGEELKGKRRDTQLYMVEQEFHHPEPHKKREHKEPSKDDRDQQDLKAGIKQRSENEVKDELVKAQAHDDEEANTWDPFG